MATTDPIERSISPAVRTKPRPKAWRAARRTPLLSEAKMGRPPDSISRQPRHRPSSLKAQLYNPRCRPPSLLAQGVRDFRGRRGMIAVRVSLKDVVLGDRNRRDFDVSRRLLAEDAIAYDSGERLADRV